MGAEVHTCGPSSAPFTGAHQGAKSQVEQPLQHGMLASEAVA